MQLRIFGKDGRKQKRPHYVAVVCNLSGLFRGDMGTSEPIRWKSEMNTSRGRGRGPADSRQPLAESAFLASKPEPHAYRIISLGSERIFRIFRLVGCMVFYLREEGVATLDYAFWQASN